jgi:hypothetical protein
MRNFSGATRDARTEPCSGIACPLVAATVLIVLSDIAMEPGHGRRSVNTGAPQYGDKTSPRARLLI